jgi:hypothetical protein
MMRSISCACLSLLSLVAVVAAQDKPDFSGQWELVATAASSVDAASRLTVRQPIARTNVFGAPMKPAFATLTVERAFGDRATTETFQIGIQGGIVGGGGVRTRFSVGWEGDSLVIASGKETYEHREVWALDPDGLLIITETDTEAGHASTSKRLPYRRN